MKNATKITPQKLNFYDEIFNWKKESASRLVQTKQGVKLVPRKVKLGSLTRGTLNMTKTDLV